MRSLAQRLYPGKPAEVYFRPAGRLEGFDATIRWWYFVGREYYYLGWFCWAQERMNANPTIAGMCFLKVEICH